MLYWKKSKASKEINFVQVRICHNSHITQFILIPKISSYQEDNQDTGLYYEVMIQTCRVSQLGWAKLSVSNDGTILPSSGKDSFILNSGTCDGVGDDAFSFGFDGYPNLSFHNRNEYKYGTAGENWIDGDIIVCTVCFAR